MLTICCDGQGIREKSVMRELFQKELSEVQERLVDLSLSVTGIMEKASIAFLSSDVKKADEAIALCDINEERALVIDEMAIRILTTQAKEQKGKQKTFLRGRQ